MHLLWISTNSILLVSRSVSTHLPGESCKIGRVVVCRCLSLKRWTLLFCLSLSTLSGHPIKTKWTMGVSLLRVMELVCLVDVAGNEAMACITEYIFTKEQTQD